MTSLRIKYLIYGLLFLTLNVVNGKHIISRSAVVSNSTIEIIDGLTCFVCGLGKGSSPAEHLSDCDELQTCKPGDYCYLEHIYDIEKDTDYYVGGCRASDTCHLQTCLKDHASTHGRRQDHTKLVHCSECCSSSLCNGKLCNLPNDRRLNYTTCYSCQNIRDPKRCHHITDCAPNEECSVDAQVVVSSDAYIRYDLGCKQRTVCKDQQTIQKRHVWLASKCCNTTLCNDYYKGENKHHTIRRPASFTCPPMPTTYSLTTSTTPSSTTTCMPTTTTTSTPTTITTTTITTSATHPSTTPSTTDVLTTQFVGQCRDRPGTGISCIELMSISGFCSSLIADKYCAESCNHCTNTGHIMTPDPVITSHIMTTDPVIAGNFLTPDPQTIFGKK